MKNYYLFTNLFVLFICYPKLAESHTENALYIKYILTH